MMCVGDYDIKSPILEIIVEENRCIYTNAMLDYNHVFIPRFQMRKLWIFFHP